MTNDMDMRRGMALAQAVEALIRDMAATTSSGFHPAEVSSALGAVAGAHLGASGASKPQRELYLRGMMSAARGSMETAVRDTLRRDLATSTPPSPSSNG